MLKKSFLQNVSFCILNLKNSVQKFKVYFYGTYFFKKINSRRAWNHYDLLLISKNNSDCVKSYQETFDFLNFYILITRIDFRNLLVEAYNFIFEINKRQTYCFARSFSLVSKRLLICEYWIYPMSLKT